MKNVFLIFLISLLSILSAQAQLTNLVYSAEKIPEKEISKYKLEILKNGNTANVGFNPGVGFFCTLYDTNRKMISHTIVPTKFEMNANDVKCVLEINNEVVVFIKSVTDNSPILLRYIFDGFTGKLKKEEILITMYFDKKLIVLTDTDYLYMPCDFFIQKDPNSDYYAVSSFNFFAKINNQIEVNHYSPTHEVISKAFLTTPEIKYLKSYYTDVYVNGGKSVILSSFLYKLENEKNEDKEAACFYLSELKAGASSFRSVRAFETIFYVKAEAMFFFNKVTNKVSWVSAVYSKGEKGKVAGFSVISQIVNLETLTLTDAFNLYSEQINTAYKANTNGRSNYSGFPQHYSVNSKGNAVILSEIFYERVYQYLGISSFTPTGQEKYGMYVNYLHGQASSSMSFVYSRGLSGQYEPYYSDTNLGLVSGELNSYLFINNTVARFKLGEKDPLPWTPISANSEFFTSFIYTINDAGVTSKEYIFGEPLSKLEKKYCRFSTADYDPATGLYAVIVVDDIKGKKTVGVLWMNLK